jgi:ribosome-binding protein aMBF1 (putative translation factor)
MNTDKNQKPPANDDANMPKREHQKATKRRKAVERTGKRTFTVKQQRLIDCYAGDIREAAQKAGLSYDYARRLVTRSHILEAIRNRQESRMGTPTNY